MCGVSDGATLVRASPAHGDAWYAVVAANRSNDFTIFNKLFGTFPERVPRLGVPNVPYTLSA